GTLPLGPWLMLEDQPPETIGLFEDEWNHHDTLDECTKLLHNTEIETQPWKTGLRADWHEYAQPPRTAAAFLRAVARRVLKPRAGMRYRPHPDPLQERYFFKLLLECIEEGSITTADLRAAIRRQHVRRDAFACLASLAE
ncbi:MAG: hypothetical protein JO359_12175, partial [Candidatus Eremiobacteraeota bacterium]|nr:hypothetical protein [Candidatus Eremiobacteraeota bacterium]